MGFDFFAAVGAPFRMQPGLRRMAPGCTHLTPLAPGSRHQREKLAVLSAFADQALVQRPGFEPRPALEVLCRLAAAERAGSATPWRWDGQTASADWLGVAVRRDGHLRQSASGRFGLGDELHRCLSGLPADWRLAGLLSLAFAEDLAIVDGRDGTVPWMAVALPSHWAPQEKVGRHFSEIHAPVADNALLLRAAEALMRLVTEAGAGVGVPDERAERAGQPLGSGRPERLDRPEGTVKPPAAGTPRTTGRTGMLGKTSTHAAGTDPPARWERFVWNVTDHPRLHAHPQRVDPQRWQHTPVEAAWFRSEHQGFVPVPGQAQAVFTIAVQVQRLQDALPTPAHARALHDAVASMSPAVLAYRNLAGPREALLAWLARRADAAESEATAGPGSAAPAPSGTRLRP